MLSILEDLNKGEIYFALNTVTNEGYVGKCNKYVGKNNTKWGTDGRWKSHMREAVQLEKNENKVVDHCRLLNNALRKYGPNVFEVYTICDCHLDEMSELEEKYIKEYGTLTPNGYNLQDGKVSEESLRYRNGKKESKEKMTYRPATSRTQDEDGNDLPEYIHIIREDGITVGYGIYKFPAKDDIVSKTFYNKDNLDEALVRAIQYLNKLKIANCNKVDIDEVDVDAYKLKANNKMFEIYKQGLPDNIFPIIAESKIAGYYVEGLHADVPRKDFIGFTNKYNLQQAEKYVANVKMIIQNKIQVDDWSTIQTIAKQDKQGIDKYYLPKYVNITKKNGVQVGFCVNGLKYIENGEKKVYTRAFKGKSLSMDEKYKLVIDHLAEMKIKFEIQD